MKKCSKCGKEYPSTEEYFYKGKESKGGLRASCKKCYSERYYFSCKEKKEKYNKEYNIKHNREIKIHGKIYREKHRDQIAFKKRERYLKDRDKILLKSKNDPATKERSKRYRDKNREELSRKSREYNAKNREFLRQYGKEYREKNKEKIRKRCLEYYHKNRETIRCKERLRRKEDVEYRISCNLRRRLRYALRSQNIKKSNYTIELTGCSLKQLVAYLESLFLPGMNWNNYGKNGWEIDHIKPCASFVLADIESRKECFNYKNLRPMWHLDNNLKNSFYNGVLIRRSKNYSNAAVPS